MESVIDISHLSKCYRLGQINTGYLFSDLQSFIARKRKLPDPNERISSLSEKRGFFYALKDIDLKIYKGDRVGIIGRNGAGKSTLLKLISGITVPTSGEIAVTGKVSSLLEVGTGFHPEMTGRENIYMNGAILGMRKKEIDEKIEAIIDFSEIREHIDTPVKRYSSGMYVRLAFAVAAHLESDILIADEILAVGDAAFQKKALGKMNDLSQGNSKTVLFVSHNIAAVRQLCNKGVVLEEGAVAFYGDIESAITLYEKKGVDSFKTEYDFTNLKRQENNAILLGTWAKITSVRILNKEKAIYSSSESIELSVCYEVSKDISNLELAAILQSTSDIPIGFIECKETLSNYSNSTSEHNLSLDASILAPGDYQLYFQLYSIQDDGYYELVDQVEKVYFEVEKGSTQIWMSPYWGHIKIPNH